MKIGIVDYGLGNIQSVKNAILFHAPDISVDLVHKPDELNQFDKLILPGVGAFGDAMKLINEKGWNDVIKEEAKKGKYILGICLGMQLLSSRSYEFGEHQGLNLIAGEVTKFDLPSHYRIPHIGWNNVHFNYSHPLAIDVEQDADFYFVHSYHFKCDDPQYALANTSYGNTFTSVVAKENIMGVQFHPEKSQEVGLKLISNFIEL